MACISLAKAIGQIHVRAISAFHFQLVNATLLRVSLDFFTVVSKSVPLEAPWVVVAVLCAQYVSTDVVATGKGAIADGIKHGHLQRLASDTAFCASIHTFLKGVVSGYFKDGIPDAETLKACSRLLSSVGEAIVSKDDDKRDRTLAKSECTFYSALAALGVSGAGQSYHFKETFAVAEEHARSANADKGGAKGT